MYITDIPDSDYACKLLPMKDMQKNVRTVYTDKILSVFLTYSQQILGYFL